MENRIVSLGYIKDKVDLSLIYSAVDTFVIPSIEDNFPNTILESLACGTPVVGFNIREVYLIWFYINSMVFLLTKFLERH